MNDWLGLAFIALVILCGLVGLWRVSQPYDITVDEFEKRAAQSAGWLSAGISGLQKILDPAEEKAVAVQEDFKQGRYDLKQAKGDGADAGEAHKEKTEAL